MAKELCRTVYKRTILVVAVAAFSLLTTACKINKDANCLNPKASCYKKDTEAPSITATNPVSSIAMPGGPTAQNSLPSFVVTFSEPMKNADQKSSYPNPTGSGSNGMTISSISKIDDRNFQVNLAGTPIAGIVSFNLSALTDLSGNPVANATFYFNTNGIQSDHDYISGVGGYSSTVLHWQNNTGATISWSVKKGGSSCATASAISGGPGVQNGTGLVNGGTINTTINFSEIPTDQTSMVFWVCQTDGASINIELYITLNRDDIGPTSSAVTPNSPTFAFPATIYLNCSDNVDKIAYTIDGVTTPVIVAPNITVGSTYTVTGINLPLPAASGDGQRTVQYLCLDKAGHVEGTVKSIIYKGELQWANADLQSERWDWAHWR